MKGKLQFIICRMLFSAAFVAATAILVMSAAERASAQSRLPPGSYQQTCKDIKFENATLSAWCAGKYNEGEFQMGRTQIELAHLCGSIDNIQGKLTCGNQFGSPAYKTAVIVFKQAAMTVFGRPPGGDDTSGELPAWAFLMVTKYGSPAFYFAGMKLDAAEYVLKSIVAETKNTTMRKDIIDRAYFQATGSKSTAAQYAAWDAKLQQKSATFASISEAARQDLNQHPTDRKIMVEAAYVTAFGRMPIAAELSYWQPRTEGYKQVVEAARTWMYSPNGAKDLADAVASVLQINLKRKPSDDEVKNAIGGYQKNRPIFMEMRGAMTPLYY